MYFLNKNLPCLRLSIYSIFKEQSPHNLPIGSLRDLRNTLAAARHLDIQMVKSTRNLAIALMVELGGIEPPTSCVQGRRSPS